MRCNIDQMEQLELNSEMSSNLLKDLLDFGQLGENKFKLNPDIHNITEIVEKTTIVLRKQIQSKKIDMQIEQLSSTDSLAHVLIDSSRIG